MWRSIRIREMTETTFFKKSKAESQCMLCWAYSIFHLFFYKSLWSCIYFIAFMVGRIWQFCPWVLIGHYCICKTTLYSSSPNFLVRRQPLLVSKPLSSKEFSPASNNYYFVFFYICNWFSLCTVISVSIWCRPSAIQNIF